MYNKSSTESTNLSAILRDKSIEFLLVVHLIFFSPEVSVGMYSALIVKLFSLLL